MPKKKAKRTVARRRSSHSVEKVDEHSFLIIAGGGFVIIAVIMLFLANRPATSMQAKQTSEVTTTEKKTESTVTIENYSFTSETTTVKVGTTVTWVNNDTVSHSVVADDSSFDTGILAAGEKGSYTFTKAGTYTYHCGLHPNMTGVVVVE